MTMSAVGPVRLISPAAPEPSLPPTQFVSPEGELTPAGAEQGVDVVLARQLYRDMARARRFDREALALQRQGELKLWLMSWGQEAAQVGSARALRDSDPIFPSYREHAVGLVRGLSPRELMAQWRGVTHAGWQSLQAAKFHIYSLVLGTQTLHAVGYAHGVALEGSDDVVVVYVGDGAASEGDVNEALNWAAAGSLPIVFFVQNNQWAISTPASAQMAAPLHRRAAGFGMPGFHVDGNDALAVHEVTRQAVAHARSGAGPALVEAQTYRLAGHSSSDDPKRYREDDDVAAWTARDPLTRLRVVLENHGTPASWFERLDESLEKLAETTRAECRALEAPEFDDLFAAVYAEPHATLEEERVERARRIAGMEGM
ncbi:thiamine pyrophosphate-dependent enzyme [Microbacterium sp. RD1]|uniref:thiamine pyrophosphate-dependent enzyme n=1 Tax=Microbacterium sp. RD1 TaxID=3457313 RepID=UPI003FA56F43